MTLNDANQRLRHALDWAFLAGVVFAIVLAGKIVPFLIAVGVLPIPFMLDRLRQRQFAVRLTRLLAPAIVYFSYALFTYFFFTGLQPGEARPVNPGMELYVVAIAMFIIGILRSLEIDGLRKKFDIAVPWTLVAAFVVLSVMMLAGYRVACRVQAGAAWPFIPALLFGTLTFLSFFGWNNFSSRERHFRLVLNAFAVVVILAYTGSRGIALAQACVLLILLGMSLMARFRGTVPSWHQLLLSTFAGLALCAVVGLTTGCGPLERILPMLTTFDILSAHAQEKVPQAPGVSTMPAPAKTEEQKPPASEPSGGAVVENGMQVIPGTDMSIVLRLGMWKTSLHAIAEAPIFGHGSLYLQHLITERYQFEHNHNQYLSWLVTGGIVGLGIGLLFLSIPWLVSAGLNLPDRLIMTLAVSVFWGLSMIFDSFFNLKFYTHYYCLLCGVLYALANDTLVGERQPESST